MKHFPFSDPVRETIKDLFTIFIPLLVVGMIAGFVLYPYVSNYLTFLK
jgi:hypothetical protein